MVVLQPEPPPCESCAVHGRADRLLRCLLEEAKGPMILLTPVAHPERREPERRKRGIDVGEVTGISEWLAPAGYGGRDVTVEAHVLVDGKMRCAIVIVVEAVLRAQP